MPDLGLEPWAANFLLGHFENVVSLALLPWMAPVVLVAQSKSRSLAGALVFTLDYHSFVLLWGLITAPLLAFRPPVGVGVVALGCAAFLVASLRGVHSTSWLQCTVKGAIVGAWSLLGVLLLGLVAVPLRVPF